MRYRRWVVGGRVLVLAVSLLCGLGAAAHAQDSSGARLLVASEFTTFPLDNSGIEVRGGLLMSHAASPLFGFADQSRFVLGAGQGYLAASASVVHFLGTAVSRQIYIAPGLGGYLARGAVSPGASVSVGLWNAGAGWPFFIECGVRLVGQGIGDALTVSVGVTR